MLSFRKNKNPSLILMVNKYYILTDFSVLVKIKEAILFETGVLHFFHVNSRQLSPKHSPSKPSVARSHFKTIEGQAANSTKLHKVPSSLGSFLSRDQQYICRTSEVKYNYIQK